MNAVVLKDVRGTLSADILEYSGGCNFVISEEGPRACEGIDFGLHWCPRLWHSLVRQESVGYPGLLGYRLVEYVRNIRTAEALRERRH